MMKTFILVAGVDYEFKGVDFRIFCNNRLKRMVAANRRKEDLQFIIFDFRQGAVVTTDVTYPGGKKVEKVSALSPSPFQAIKRSHYSDVGCTGGDAHYRFKDGQSSVLSIQDIYKAVQKIGVDAPGTLFELSFFSHAWMGGPILVNSCDDGVMNLVLPYPAGAMSFPLPSGARDPDDKDPRVKDFGAPTMSASDLTHLRDAFHPDGHIWIWGCAFPRLVHEVLHKIERHAAYRSSGLGDDVVFKITNFNSAQADFLERWLLSELGAPFPDKKKIEIEFKFLKHFFCKVTTASYTHHLARNANVKTFGGLMGTYSEYDSGRLPLMSVHKGFARHFTFYKNYLGFKLDPEGRKYGEYLPGFSCPAP